MSIMNGLRGTRGNPLYFPRMGKLLSFYAEVRGVFVFRLRSQRRSGAELM
jgi:hypothetical protein